MQWAIVIGLSLVVGAIMGRMSRVGTEAAVRRRVVLTPSQIESARVQHMLTDRCQVRAPAVVLDPGSGHALPCRFESLAAQTVRLSLLVDPEEASGLAVHAMAAVQFNLEQRARMFIAPILESHCGEDGVHRLDIATPTFVTDGETRGAFRVTISERFDVAAVVLHGDRDYVARVIELSTTGAGLDFAAVTMPDFSLGEEVEMQLSFEGKVAQRTAVVRRIDGTACGLSLEPSVGDTAAEDEVAFSEFIRAMIDREACRNA